MANEAMQAAWDGEEGDHWAEFADRYDSASVRISAALQATIPGSPTASPCSTSVAGRAGCRSSSRAVPERPRARH